MATLKLSPEEIDILRQDEADFIMDQYSKDLTVQRLRPSHHNRVISNDQITYNYMKDTIDTIIPLANKNGTPITLNLLATALGFTRSLLYKHIHSVDTVSLNEAEKEWFEKINELLLDTLSIARADIESLQLSRKIDSSSAARAIKDIDIILEEDTSTPQGSLNVKIVDDLNGN